MSITDQKRRLHMKPYRQGDVLIIPVAELPEGTKRMRRGKRGVVLAEGEVTGHAHAILDRGASLYELVTADDVDEMRRRFLLVEQEVAVTHEEHGTVTLPPGSYEIRIQREYSPEEIRQVQD